MSPIESIGNNSTYTSKTTKPLHETQAKRVFKNFMRDIKFKSQAIVRESSWCRFHLQNMLLFFSVIIVFVLCFYDRHENDEKRYDSFLIARGSCNLKQDDTFFLYNKNYSTQCFEDIVSPGEMHNPWMLFIFMGIAAAIKNR